MSGTRIEVVELCKHGEEAAHSGSDVPHHPDYWYCTGGSRRTLTPGEYPTPDQLRDIAWTLDSLSKVTRCLMEPAAEMDAMNAATLEVTVELTRDGEPLSSADARKLLDWVGSDEMQSDLRTWADALAGADHTEGT